MAKDFGQHNPGTDAGLLHEARKSAREGYFNKNEVSRMTKAHHKNLSAAKSKALASRKKFKTTGYITPKESNHRNGPFKNEPK